MLKKHIPLLVRVLPLGNGQQTPAFAFLRDRQSGRRQQGAWNRRCGDKIVHYPPREVLSGHIQEKRNLIQLLVGQDSLQAQPVGALHVPVIAGKQNYRILP
ncbi:hypothetical protein D3C75_601110 [compost metagenome]